MKKILFILVLAGFPLLTFAQTLTDLSKYHDDNRMWEKTDDNFDIMKKTSNNYASLYVRDSSETITLTEDVWAQVTNATNTLWIASSLGMSNTGDSITIATAGDYYADVSLSFKATSDDTLQVAVFKNAVLATGLAEVQAIGTETLSVSVSILLVNLVSGDDLSVRMVNTASGDDASVKDGSLVVHMLKAD